MNFFICHIVSENEHSPYMRNKWNEQEMIQTRRSVSSSPSSESESNDAQDANKHQQQQQQIHIPPLNMQAPQMSNALRMTEMMLNEAATVIPTPNASFSVSNISASSATKPAMNQSFGRPHSSNEPSHPMCDDDVNKIPKAMLTTKIPKLLLDNMQIPYGNLSQQNLPNQSIHSQHTSAQINQSFNYADDNNQFGTTVGTMFPPQNINAQIPFPTPGPPTFGAPYSSASNSQQPPNHDPISANTSLNYPSNPCAAAFTSSSSNLGKFCRIFYFSFLSL